VETLLALSFHTSSGNTGPLLVSPLAAVPATHTSGVGSPVLLSFQSQFWPDAQSLALGSFAHWTCCKHRISRNAKYREFGCDLVLLLLKLLSLFCHPSKLVAIFFPTLPCICFLVDKKIFKDF
jgi:hypothetical protein